MALFCVLYILLDAQFILPCANPVYNYCTKVEWLCPLHLKSGGGGATTTAPLPPMTFDTHALHTSVMFIVPVHNVMLINPSFKRGAFALKNI